MTELSDEDLEQAAGGDLQPEHTLVPIVATLIIAK